MTDLGDLGRTAAELMDELSEEHELATLDAVVIVVALRTDSESWVRYRASDRRQWVQRALLREASELAELSDEDVDEDPDMGNSL